MSDRASRPPWRVTGDGGDVTPFGWDEAEVWSGDERMKHNGDVRVAVIMLASVSLAIDLAEVTPPGGRTRAEAHEALRLENEALRARCDGLAGQIREVRVAAATEREATDDYLRTLHGTALRDCPEGAALAAARDGLDAKLAVGEGKGEGRG